MFRHGTPNRFGTFATLWHSTLLPLLHAAGARTVAEIGADTGDLSRLLTAYCAERGGTAHIIDPSPAFIPANMRWELGEAFVFHRTTSIEVLSSLPSMDAVLIDGDHNWHTVTRELEIITERAGSAEKFPLVILHDTGWPYGRRDMYYAPERIPAEHRHPHDKLGMRQEQSHLSYGGVNGNHFNARNEGGERNGVRTAAEDYLKSAPFPLRFMHVPGIHGVGILVSEARLQSSPVLAELLASLQLTPAAEKHAEAVENDRLRLARRVADLETMAHVLREENKRLRTLKHESEPLRRQIAELTLQAERLKHIEHTKSWRITAPLRALEKFLRRR